MSLTACIASGSGSSSACFRPANCASSTSRWSICWIDSYVARASSECQSYVASARTAPAVSSGSVASSISAQRASSPSSPASWSRSCGQGLVERGPHLVERAAEVAAPPGRVAHPPHPRGELVEAPVAVEAAPQQVGQRVAHRAAGEHVAAQLVERRPDVVRRRERVGTVVPGAVAEPAHRQAP